MKQKYRQEIELTVQFLKFCMEKKRISYCSRGLNLSPYGVYHHAEKLESLGLLEIKKELLPYTEYSNKGKKVQTTTFKTTVLGHQSIESLERAIDILTLPSLE